MAVTVAVVLVVVWGAVATRGPCKCRAARGQKEPAAGRDRTARRNVLQSVWTMAAATQAVLVRGSWGSRDGGPGGYST